MQTKYGFNLSEIEVDQTRPGSDQTLTRPDMDQTRIISDPDQTRPSTGANLSGEDLEQIMQHLTL